jgi:charged multivesicular body protein 2A
MMSRQMNLPQIQRILQEFERESSQMDMKEEMMGESIDDAMDENEGETEEEEGNKILDEVLAEIGISVEQQVKSPIIAEERGPFGGLSDATSTDSLPMSQLGNAPDSLPTQAVAETNQRTAVAMGAEGGGGGGSGGGPADDLQARLDNLRKD